MIDGIRLKICGLTSLVDAEFADQCGADYLGFILHPKSPRFVSLEQYRAIATHLPERRRVAVCVEPTAAELALMSDAGFDRFQVHFRAEMPLPLLTAWSEAVTAERLWLAPKLPPGAPFAVEWLPHAGTFLLDAFHPGVFGGSGQTGDWANFARQRQERPEKTWILAGGLTPENIGEALQASGARFVDVNSGVETAPGVKDHGKMKRLVTRMREHRSGQNS